MGVGGRSGGGASGAVSGVSATGNASASLQYAEQPTIRYVPLQGQALIQQIATPIDVDSIVNLFDSDWPLIAVLDLATERITPRYEDSYSALNAIVALDQYGALVLAAGKSQLSAKKEEAPAVPKGTAASPIVIQTPGGGASPASNNSLVLFFEPDSVSVEPIIGTELKYAPEQTLVEPHSTQVGVELNGKRVVRFNDYRPNGGDTCLPPPAGLDGQLLAAKKNVLHLWLRLLGIYDGTQPLSDELTASAAAAVPRRKGVADRRRAASTENQVPHAPLPKYPSDTDRKQFEQRIDAAVTDRELDNIIKSLPRSIELRTSPIAVGGYRNRAPVLRTRSALGLLKAAAQAMPRSSSCRRSRRNASGRSRETTLI
jgi:hypothetical protein